MASTSNQGASYLLYAIAAPIIGGVSVFGGPVFRADDRVFRGVKLPREFYKVIAFVEGGKLKARAFLLTQNLDQLEALDLDRSEILDTIQRITTMSDDHDDVLVARFGGSIGEA